MYNYNSEIKLKIQNDFSQKKMLTVKKNFFFLNSDKRYCNVEQTLSNYKRSIQ